ncbi:MAG: hypothetical protein JXR03_13480 [Cyclobacteriaceae bacterium]
MKKILRNICLLIGIVIIYSCSNDYELPGVQPNHFVVYLSEEFFENTIEVGTHVDFADVSQGVVSRTWSFPEGVVEINGQSVTTTSENRFRADFMKIGTFEVSLTQEYKGDAWIETEQVGAVIDTTYTIEVIDSITASFESEVLDYLLEPQGAITITDNGESEIEAGSSITYFVTSTGEPGSNTWYFEGGTPEVYEPTNQDNADTVTILYKSLGTYDIELISSRFRPRGSDTLSFTNAIKTIPSTAPILVSEASRVDRSTISIAFSREIDTPPVGVGSKFDVTIRNNGTVINPSVASVRVDGTDATIVYLDIADEMLYSSDTITFDYTPTGDNDLVSLDFYTLDSFEEISVDPNYDFMFDPSLGGFEFDEGFGNNVDDDAQLDLWVPEGAFTKSTERSKSGATSGRLEYQTGAGDWTAASAPRFNFTAGETYNVHFSYYVESGDGAFFQLFYLPVEWGGTTFDISTKGAWLTGTSSFTALGDAQKVRCWFRATNASAVVFIDDILCWRADPRP